MTNSNNPSSADNQQERPYLKVQDIPLELAWYLIGFTDGEGSFNISFKRELNYGIGWKVDLSFNVSQRDANIPKMFQQILDCGTIRYRKDGVCYFEVRKFSDIQDKVIPFFDRFPLKSKKLDDYKTFKTIALIVFQKRHLTEWGMKELLKLRETMNSGGKRKYSSIEILNGCVWNPQRLYAKSTKVE